jgi:hypothetical protein
MLHRLKKKHPNVYLILTASALIMFWNGLWGILDQYLFPDNPLLSDSICIVVGLAILYFNDFSFNEFEHPNPR